MKKFSFNDIENFDNHILQSIPNYDILFNSILRISDYFRDESKTIYDVGCSTGNLLRYIKRAENYKGKMIGIDYSRNLLPENTKEYNNISFLEYDLNKSFSFDDACVIYSIFTLQFLRKESRQMVLDNIYKGLCKGGALIIAEKTYVDEGQFQDIFTFSYYDYKKASFTSEQILSKEKDLRTILKPNYSADNLDMLYRAGFSQVQMFYKFFHFEAHLAIK